MVLLRPAILCLFLSLCGCTTTSEDYEYPVVTYAPPLMKLEIRNYVTYELPIVANYLVVKYHKNTFREDELGLSRPDDKAIELSESQKSTIMKLLDSAIVNMPLRDGWVAPDGSIWVLESRIYQEVIFSIWTPNHQMENRGYSNLIALESYLSELANMGDAHNKLNQP